MYNIFKRKASLFLSKFGKPFYQKNDKFRALLIPSLCLTIIRFGFQAIDLQE